MGREVAVRTLEQRGYDPARLFKVTSSTPPKPLGAMVARALLEADDAVLTTVGGEGVHRAIKASIYASDILRMHGIGMAPIPFWETVEGDRRLPSGQAEPISAIFFRCVAIRWAQLVPR